MDPRHRAQNRLILAICAIVIVALVASVIVTSIMNYSDSRTVTTSTAPKEVLNIRSSPDAGQPCNYLTHEGDPLAPERITLWCDGGHTSLVINTADMERYVWEKGASRSTGNGSHVIDVRSGGHFAYNLVTVQLEDGSVDYRVWYDDTLVEREESGGSVVESSTSRVTTRNFAAESIDQTHSLGY